MSNFPLCPKKRYRLKNGKRLISATLIFIAALMFLCTLAKTEVSAQDAADSIRVVVQPGDSLWIIAGEYNRDGRIDIRQFIYQIKKANGLLTSVLTPGQILVIPSNW